VKGTFFWEEKPMIQSGIGIARERCNLQYEATASPFATCALLPSLQDPDGQQPCRTLEIHGRDKRTEKCKLLKHGLLLACPLQAHSQPFFSPCSPYGNMSSHHTNGALG